MFNWFKQDTTFMQRMHTFANLVVLNLLWLLCCLPVVTIGASTAALYRCVFALCQNEDSGYRKFFSAFRSHFKLATLSWLIILVASLILYADYHFAIDQPWLFSSVLLAAYVIVALVILIANPFLFPLISQFDARVWQTLKNAFLCGISWLPRTVLIMVLWAIPIAWLLIFPYWFWYFAWGWISFGFALIAFLSVKLMKKPFAFLRTRC